MAGHRTRGTGTPQAACPSISAVGLRRENVFSVYETFFRKNIKRFEQMTRGDLLVATGVVLGFFTVLFEHLSAQQFHGMFVVAIVLVMAGGVLIATSEETSLRRTNCEACGAPNTPDSERCQYCEKSLQ